MSPTPDLGSVGSSFSTTNRSLERLESNNLSNTSLLSTSSRRRAREVEDLDGMLEGRFENSPRRARVDTEMLAREAFTPDPDESAIYFYFPLNFAPNGEVPGQGRESTRREEAERDEAEEEAALEASEASEAPEAHSSGAETPRRRSSRLMGLFGQRSREAESTPLSLAEGAAITRGSTMDDDASGPSSPLPGQQQLVLVRIRHLPNTTTAPTAPSPGQSSGTAAAGSSANVEPEAAANVEGASSAVFQWTIYFVMPRPDDPASPPPIFNPNDALQRAFAVLRAMMAGENMGYEEWIRLQEMLGTVSRGVSKEQVERQCASQAFSALLNIGVHCPICLADYVADERVRTLPCAHSYHADCIDTWLGSCNSCPLCRQQSITITTTPSPPAEPQ